MLLSVFFSVGCVSQETYYGKLELEVRLCYERGDSRAGQMIEPTQMAIYQYDGKEHCPEARFFYNGIEVFPKNKGYLWTKNSNGNLAKPHFVERGEYTIVADINYSDKYKVNSNQTFLIRIE